MSLVPRSAIPYLNKLSGSSMNNRTQDPLIIGYPNGWKTGPSHEWYEKQPYTKFTHIQYRKEREAPFYHEYIVVELENDTVCRFDRRGDVNTRANAFTLDGITAEDTAHIIDKTIIGDKDDPYRIITDKSDLLLRIHFPKGDDLLTILGIVYSVQKDADARAYTLTKFNCYFMSWTIVTATARRTVDWALLGKETNKWEDLVKTTIEGLNSDSGAMSRLKTRARNALGLGRKGDTLIHPSADTIPFIGSSYLISTLRQALVNTRTDIQKSLGELILRTTVEPSVRKISEHSSREAALEAAKSHAGQAARDAAMEAVIESMWRTILSSENGGQLWEDQCKATENSVWLAASAAARADLDANAAARAKAVEIAAARANGDVVPETEEPEVEESIAKSWEVAWDNTWEESWSSNLANEKSRSNDASDDSSKADISIRAKTAWRRAWTEAREANEEYVPLVTEGVAKYVNKNLPESMPEVLKIDTSVRLIPTRLHTLD